MFMEEIPTMHCSLWSSWWIASVPQVKYLLILFHPVAILFTFPHCFLLSFHTTNLHRKSSHSYTESIMLYPHLSTKLFSQHAIHCQGVCLKNINIWHTQKENSVKYSGFQSWCCSNDVQGDWIWLCRDWSE